MAKCGGCNLPAKRTEAHIVCSACKLKFHEQCSHLLNNEFSLMSSRKSSLKWFCRVCDPYVTEVLTNLEKYKKMNVELKNVRDDIDKKLADFEVRVQKCEKVEQNPNIASAIQKVVKDSLPSIEFKNEQELIEKNKCNLIFFKIPESTSTDTEARIKHDYEKLVEIFGSDNIRCTDIANIYRVGKITDIARPLVVRFNNIDTKKKYCDLSFGKKLSLKFENEVVNISVTHDKTKKQREESKARYESMANARIRNNQADTGVDTGAVNNGASTSNFQNQPRGPKPTWANVLKNLV